MSSNSTEPSWTRDVPDERAVTVLAAHFARCVEPPTVIFLRGDLGAGKTTFARAYVHAMGFGGYVKSPSYGLLETYDVRGQQVLHLDLYRIDDPEELEFLAIRDLYDQRTVLLVEWPDRGERHLPDPDMELEFGENDESRFIRCRVFSSRGEALAACVNRHAKKGGPDQS